MCFGYCPMIIRNENTHLVSMRYQMKIIRIQRYWIHMIIRNETTQWDTKLFKILNLHEYSRRDKLMRYKMKTIMIQIYWIHIFVRDETTHSNTKKMTQRYWIYMFVHDESAQWDNKSFKILNSHEYSRRDKSIRYKMKTIMIQRYWIHMIIRNKTNHMVSN